MIHKTLLGINKNKSKNTQRECPGTFQKFNFKKPVQKGTGLCKSCSADLTNEFLLLRQRQASLWLTPPCPQWEEWSTGQPLAAVPFWLLGGRVTVAVLVFLRSHCCWDLLHLGISKRNYWLKTYTLKVINYFLDPGNIVNDFCVDPIHLCFPTIIGAPGHYSSHKPPVCLIVEKH